MTPAPTTPWASNRPGRRGFPKATARRIIRRDKWCQLQYPGCTEEATQADHIVGYRDAIVAGWDPADINDETNGQGACTSCHSIKTKAEAARGRQRARQARPATRPTPKHPGMI